MRITVESVADLGLPLRAARKGARVRLDDLADIAGVSKQFVSDVEYGKQTVQLGRVLKLLAEMGLQLTVDLPPAADGLAGSAGQGRRGQASSQSGLSDADLDGVSRPASGGGSG